MIQVNIKLFASLREQLGQQALCLDIEPGVTITELSRILGEVNGSEWSSILTEDNVITAVNKIIVERTHVLQNNDELAYFPPVTGG
ncbi:MAG: molybdopterin synthase sulfur carrier subunit [Candidatus Azotimanducaceae bacterium]